MDTVADRWTKIAATKEDLRMKLQYKYHKAYHSRQSTEFHEKIVSNKSFGTDAKFFQHSPNMHQKASIFETFLEEDPKTPTVSRHLRRFPETCFIRNMVNRSYAQLQNPQKWNIYIRPWIIFPFVTFTSVHNSIKITSVISIEHGESWRRVAKDWYCKRDRSLRQYKIRLFHHPTATSQEIAPVLKMCEPSCNNIHLNLSFSPYNRAKSFDRTDIRCEMKEMKCLTFPPPRCVESILDNGSESMCELTRLSSTSLIWSFRCFTTAFRISTSSPYL